MSIGWVVFLLVRPDCITGVFCEGTYLGPDAVLPRRLLLLLVTEFVAGKELGIETAALFLC